MKILLTIGTLIFVFILCIFLLAIIGLIKTLMFIFVILSYVYLILVILYKDKQIKELEKENYEIYSIKELYKKGLIDETKENFKLALNNDNSN